jgi:hypothetical protein
MKRLLVSLILLAATVMGANEFTGLRLPWRTARIISDAIAADSAYLDTSAFLHDRQSDSAYTIYFTRAIGDTVNISILKGRATKVTVNDTLLAYKLYIDAVHAESLATTKGYVDKSDTTFFAHNDEADSTAAIYVTKATGDSAFYRAISGRVGNKMVLMDTVLLLSRGYLVDSTLGGSGVVVAESALVTKYYVDNADTASFKHDQQADSTTSLYFFKAIGDSVFATWVGGRSPWYLGDSVILPGASKAFIGAKESDSAVVTAHNLGITDSAAFKHGQDTDSTNNLYAQNIYADSLFVSGMATDSWVMKAGTHISMAWTADTAVISSDTANVHTWLDGIYLGIVSESVDVARGEIRDTAALVANDTADVLRAEMGDTARAAVLDTAVVLRAEMGDTARAAALDTGAVLRAEMGDTGRVAAHDTADVLRAEIRDTATVVWNDSASVLRAEMGDTARAAAHDTADIVRAEICDSIGSTVGDTADVVRGEIRDTSAIVAHDTADVLRGEMRDTTLAVDSLYPDVTEADRFRGGMYYFAGNAGIHLDSSTIAADSTILYLWVNTKRYALTLSNP